MEKISHKDRIIKDQKSIETRIDCGPLFQGICNPYSDCYQYCLL